MKITCILGSPRKNGNTSKILETIKKVAPKAYDVEIVLLTDYSINRCLGCSICQKETDKFVCSQNDDGNLLLEKIIDSDIIFYATPLYGHSYSGQLKIFLDRHTPLFKFVDGKEKSVNEMGILSIIEKKPVGLIVSCQGPEENNTELIKLLFDKFCESSLAQCLGKYIFPFCNHNAKESVYDEKVIEQIFSDIQSKL